MSPLSRLLAASAGAHLGDQLAAAALPLTAVLVLGAGPGTVGFLVGMQGLAWLLFSLPAGVFVDRVPKAMLIAAAQAVAAIAFVCAAIAAITGPTAALGLACFIGASGAVILSLCALALVPELAPPNMLPASNARIELARAAMTLVAPIAAGVLAERLTPAIGFAAAALACAAAAVVAKRLGTALPRLPASRPPLVAAIRQGARFAVGHELLRGIALCAVFWNFAFFALMAVAVPFALQRIGLDASRTGLAHGVTASACSSGRLAPGARSPASSRGSCSSPDRPSMVSPLLL